MSDSAITSGDYTKTKDGPIPHIKIGSVVYPVALNLKGCRGNRQLFRPERNDFGNLLYATPGGGRASEKQLANRHGHAE